jgi:tetratricopeptide (TPR) repeat protein
MLLPKNITSLFSVAALILAGEASARQDKPSTQNPNTAAIQQVEQLLSAGKSDAAIKLLATVSELSDRYIRHLLGLAYYQKADYARAIEHLSIAVAPGTDNNIRYRQDVQMLGLSHYLLGHVKDAIPYLEQVRGWAPDNIEIMYTLGMGYIQSHDRDKSREAFARMFSVSPSSASAYLINGKMMIRQQFEEFAEKELQRALEIDPRLPEANFLLGELAVYRADLERGVALLQKEIAINPSFAMAYYMLGEAYTRQLKWDEALGPLQKSIWLNPFFSGPYIVLGKVYLKKGELDTAESMLRRALSRDPNNFSGHHLLAQVLQQSNRVEEAKKEFELADKLRTSSEKNQ